jgi:hypothetical protein
MISEMKSRIDSMVTATRPSGPSMPGTGSPAGDAGSMTGGPGGK